MGCGDTTIAIGPRRERNDWAAADGRLSQRDMITAFSGPPNS
jgi:hypothetical protein